MNQQEHDQHHQPDILEAIRRDVINSREWMSRLIVLAYAALAGACVVAFTWLCERSYAGFSWLFAAWPWLPLVWTPLLCASIAWLTVRVAPGASGSGIPQVMVSLHGSIGEAQRHKLVSLRLALAKIFLTAGGLLGGLAIGREGPSVQIGAGVMQHARRWLPEGGSVTHHGLLVAGGAAGIAAAFNAPLAGVMFAIEELTRRIEQRSSGLIVIAIVLAGLVGVSVFGNATYFGVIRVPPLRPAFFWPALLVALGAGVLGGLFSRLLHASITGRMGAAGRWRAQHPVAFAATCGLAIAVLGIASHGASFGAGYEYTRQLVEGHIQLPLLYVALRILATWLAVWSGVPGGLFAPSLAIGAGLGGDIALLTGWGAESPALIALGMAGFLAAVTQAPVTAFIIVMEMVDGHAMVLSLMAASLCASVVARWLARPLYGALAAAQLARLGPTKAPAAQSAQAMSAGKE